MQHCARPIESKLGLSSSSEVKLLLYLIQFRTKAFDTGALKKIDRKSSLIDARNTATISLPFG